MQLIIDMADDIITLGHGSGGRLMHDLIAEHLAPEFGIKELNDSALIELSSSGIALTTDSYVVEPIFFPGGDIGSLSINGTINDLAMVGAEAIALTVGFIIEEGFRVLDLKKILSSMRRASNEAGVYVVAGDTKVVERGKVDRIFINTSGVGIRKDGIGITGSGAMPGDKIIISGSIGNHGIAVISERNSIEFNPPVISDTRPLNRLVRDMLGFTKEIHAMRDPTRGGLATTLKEIALSSGVGILVEEELIPIESAVRGASEMLGYDPLYLANEGILVAFVSADVAEGLLSVMRKNPYAVDASIIGEVIPEEKGRVLLKTSIGGTRVLEMLLGEQLPRIC